MIRFVSGSLSRVMTLPVPVTKMLVVTPLPSQSDGLVVLLLKLR